MTRMSEAGRIHGGGLDQPEEEGAREAAQDIAEPAQDHHHQRGDGIGQAHEGRELEEHADERAGGRRHRDAGPEAPGVQPGDVDSNKPGAVGLLHEGAHRLAGEAPPEIDVEGQREEEGHARGHHPIGREHGAEEAHRRGEVAIALEVRAPDQQRAVLQHEEEPEGQEERAGLEPARLAGGEDARVEEPVQRHADGEGRGRGDEQGEQRRHAPPRVQGEGEVGPEHQELAVRDVEHPHEPVLEVQPQRDERVDAARREPADDDVGEKRPRHGRTRVGAPDPRRLTPRRAWAPPGCPSPRSWARRARTRPSATGRPCRAWSRSRP